MMHLIRGMMLAVLAILAQGASGAAMPHAPHQGHHYGAAHEDAGSTMHVEPSHLASDEADEHPDGSHRSTGHHTHVSADRLDLAGVSDRHRRILKSQHRAFDDRRLKIALPPPLLEPPSA
ncbi:hypothetical protein [uncultured Sphingobium sp.]|jgi:hypothetical protein|uniref:hypothetical protein n=1 Tax=uncultured Sphingobium sp. TaxID=316087 RepID=UPI0032B1BB5C|tara:strand:- start:7609 stop:7968 length:360 start_codon:yes stop_codon:yes gene_type:complete